MTMRAKHLPSVILALWAALGLARADGPPELIGKHLGISEAPPRPLGISAAPPARPLPKPPETNPRVSFNPRYTPVVDLVKRVKGAVVNIHSERSVKAAGG